MSEPAPFGERLLFAHFPTGGRAPRSSLATKAFAEIDAKFCASEIARQDTGLPLCSKGAGCWEMRIFDSRGEANFAVGMERAAIVQTPDLPEAALRGTLSALSRSSRGASVQPLPS